jgi:hypothetical protein
MVAIPRTCNQRSSKDHNSIDASSKNALSTSQIRNDGDRLTNETWDVAIINIACRPGQRRVIHEGMNRNIFYIIGVIVVIIIVLKVLQVF